MKILVINIHSVRNAGDSVLLSAAISQLRANFSNCTLTLAMNDPGSYSGPEKTVDSFTAWFKRSDGDRGSWRIGATLFAPWLVAQAFLTAITFRFLGKALYLLVPRRRRALLDAYLEADLVVSSAGNFLYSSGRLGLPFLLAALTMILAIAAGKPLYMMPQSIGPLRRRWERSLVKWILNRTRLVYVRDSESLAEVTRAGLDRASFRLVPDIAFTFSASSPEEGQRLLASYGLDRARVGPLLGVTFLNWGALNRRFTGQSSYEAAMVEAVQRFVKERDGWAVLFSQVQGPSAAEDDRIPAGRAFQQLADVQQRVIYVDRPVPPQVLRSAYGTMDLFIGTRLHSNIFAMCEGVPVIAVQYQPKTLGVLEQLGLQRWAIPIEEVSGQKLYEMLSRLWDERATVREHLAQTIPAAVEEASRVGLEIAADMGRA